MISINDECIKDGVRQTIDLVRDMLDELEEELDLDDEDNE